MDKVQISFQISEDIKDKFDLWCLKNKTDKTKEIVRHIEELVGDI